MATILIVDDQAVNREFLVTLLGYQGYRLLEAADGLEALVIVREERPDLVVADILMPTMDGYEFVKRVRSDPDIEDTRVIFYTAVYHEQEALHLARSCGVSDVLTKPSEPDVILDTVERVLQEVISMPAPIRREELDQQHLRLMTDKLTLLTDDLGLANQRYAALIDISLQLASERNPRQLLDSLCHIARRLIGARYAVLAVNSREDEDTVYFTTSGINPGAVADMAQPDEGPDLLSKVVAERKPVRLTNPGGDPLALGLPESHPPVYSLLAAPIISLVHAYGWICLSERLGAEAFNEEDEHLLSILSAQAGRIYENGSLYSRLLEHEERFRQLAENVNDVFWLVSVDTGKDIYVSPAYEQIWGRSKQDLGMYHESWLEAVHPDDRSKIPALLPDTTAYDLEYRICRPDGSVRWIHDRGFPVRNPDGKVYRFAGIAKDISKRKADEEKIARLTRIYAVLSQINSVIVRVHDRQALFDEACRIVVEHGRFGMAWIGLLEQESKKVTPITFAGVAEDIDYLKHRARSTSADLPEGQGTVGRAIRELKPAYCNDIETRPDIGSSRHKALQRGYHSVISLPLLTHDRAVGVFVLYVKEPNFFDEVELKLLTELANDISFALEYIDKAERANYLAYYDVLTGLSNRAMFHERLNQFVQGAEHDRSKLGVLMLDLDRFKTINDTLGRQVGDSLIRQMAQRLKNCVDEPVQLARIGADQFGMVVPDIRHAGEVARLAAGRLREVLEKPYVLNGEELRVSTKIGIALYPDDGQDAEALFRNAELAVKKAKHSGERYLFFDRFMSEQVAENLVLENRLRLAVENNEFVLYYQPKVNLKTGGISGIEALIRWQSPELGLVAPLQFIPLLEETGIILEVGTWVLQKAVSDLSAWQAEGVAVPRIAVNVSAFQLRQPDFVQHVKQALQGFDGEVMLDIELTESMVISNIEDSIAKLRAVKALGLEVAIDDFGTGYSSLSYIARLPIDTLKIDRSFIVKMVEHSDDLMIVSTIITMAHNMKLKVVAEGVDMPEQVGILKQMGCDEMQGYLFSKPVPADEMLKLLQKSELFKIP
ncbi:EAL domain-containing protein [Nitrincola sp. MINF-07-Sa-05]|uniref:EAL domain-containing protein n=1 Tax=Nitrincola salilacus TaxID=3400273 RepID=UPI0039185C92